MESRRVDRASDSGRGFVVKISLVNREEIREISHALEEEFDRILAAISSTFLVEHDWRGRHTNINAISISGVPATQEQVAEADALQSSVENEGNTQILRAGGNPVQEGGSAGGDVTGPSSATSGNIAIFSGTTGKLLADGGSTIAQLGDVDGPSSAVNLRIAVFDGTTGKILADGGVVIADLSRIATKSLTELELESLGTTAITVTAAPGAGKVICPVRFDVQLVVTTGYSSSPTFKLIHEGDATALTGLADPVWTGIDTLFSSQVAVAVNRTISGFDPRNKALQIQASADPTGAGVATAKVRVLYYVADLN